MDKARAEAYAAALALTADGPFSVALLVGDAGQPAAYSVTCSNDPPCAPLVYVANRRRDGGAWLVSFAFRDLELEFDRDPWAKRYEIEALDRRRGTHGIYRFMGIERVWLTPECQICARLQALRGVYRTFEITPHAPAPLTRWAVVAAAIAKLTP